MATSDARRRGPVTAAELARILADDPGYQEKLRRFEEQEAAELAEARAVSAPILRDLARVGCDVDSIWEFGSHYTDALPVLAEHLRRDYPDLIRAAIANAMAVREAKPYWELFVSEYVKCHELMTKQGLANAIAKTTTYDRFDQVIELVRDERHGESRVLLLRPLKRRRGGDKGWQFLETLVDDNQLGIQARHLLGIQRYK